MNCLYCLSAITKGMCQNWEHRDMNKIDSTILAITCSGITRVKLKH